MFSLKENCCERLTMLGIEEDVFLGTDSGFLIVR